MRRAAFILATLLLVSMPAAADDLDAKFLIIHKGKVIGFHEVDVERVGEFTRVSTNVEMRVKLGPIPLYKYDHQSNELWRGGELLRLSSRTADNGDDGFVEAWRENGQLMVESTLFNGPAPDDLVVSSYWNRANAAGGAVLNIQDGEMMELAASNLGSTLAPGGRPAEHIQLVGTLTLNLWYEGGQWVGLNCEVDGEEISYERVADERQYAMLEDYLD